MTAIEVSMSQFVAGNLLVVGGRKSGRSTVVRKAVSELYAQENPGTVVWQIDLTDGGALDGVDWYASDLDEARLMLLEADDFANRRRQNRIVRQFGPKQAQLVIVIDINDAVSDLATLIKNLTTTTAADVGIDIIYVAHTRHFGLIADLDLLDRFEAVVMTTPDENVAAAFDVPKDRTSRIVRDADPALGPANCDVLLIERNQHLGNAYHKVTVTPARGRMDLAQAAAWRKVVAELEPENVSETYRQRHARAAPLAADPRADQSAPRDGVRPAGRPLATLALIPGNPATLVKDWLDLFIDVDVSQLAIVEGDDGRRELVIYMREGE